MRRVVITGMGIVSPIGNTVAEVEASLRAVVSAANRAQRLGMFPVKG